MPVFGADVATSGPTDLIVLRWSLWTEGHSGFLIANNYVRGGSMAARPHAQITVNILFGPALVTADLGALKNWAITGGVNLQFRWEAFNALNHPSFRTPQNNVTASNFGQITAIVPVPPRVMQGALKFTF